MRTRFPLTFSAAVIGSATFAAGPIYAVVQGQPDANDVKAIDACLANAAATKADPSSCIGHVSDSCIEKASTTPAVEECSNREALVWDAALNRDYAQLTKLLVEDGAKQALRDAERGFAVAKLTKCTFERIPHRNSPKAVAAAAQCAVRATARQDFWLIDQINAFKGN